MTGINPSICPLLLFLRLFNLSFIFSIRAKLRNASPGYNISKNFFLRCLYEGEEGDPRDPEEGFLKGPLLIRVSLLYSSPSRGRANDNQYFSGISSYLHIAIFCV